MDSFTCRFIFLNPNVFISKSNIHNIITIPHLTAPSVRNEVSVLFQLKQISETDVSF